MQIDGINIERDGDGYAFKVGSETFWTDTLESVGNIIREQLGSLVEHRGVSITCGDNNAAQFVLGDLTYSVTVEYRKGFRYQPHLAAMLIDRLTLATDARN